MLHDIWQFNSINVKSRLFKIFLHPRLSFISNSFYFFNYRYKYTEITRKNSVLLTNQKSKIFIYHYYYYYYFLFLISSTHEHTTTMESGYKLGLLRIFRGKNYEEKSVFQNCIFPSPSLSLYRSCAQLDYRALFPILFTPFPRRIISVKLDLPACLPLGLTSFTTRTVLTSVKTSVGSGTGWN